VPLVRVAVGDLTGRMTEYVVQHVLMHHRQELYLRQSQRDKALEAEVPMVSERDLGPASWGLARFGADAAEVLRRIGFRVAGWSRSPKQIDGIDCFFRRRNRSTPFCNGPIFWSACCR